MKTTSVMIVGVGGQGSLLASKLLGRLLMDEGFDVKVSEVRFGEKVYSPIIAEGEADIIISFEKLEAARYASYLKKDGLIVVNTQQIDPMPVIIGNAEYPENVLEELKDKGLNIWALDALALAEQAGSSKAVNIVLMGKAAKQFDIPYERWIKAIENTVAPKFVEMNKKAFDLGYNN